MSYGTTCSACPMCGSHHFRIDINPRSESMGRWGGEMECWTCGCYAQSRYDANDPTSAVEDLVRLWNAIPQTSNGGPA